MRGATCVYQPLVDRAARLLEVLESMVIPD